MSANVIAFSKATGTKYGTIPSLTLIFDTEAPTYPNDYAEEARQIAQYMYMSLPSGTIIALAEELAKQAEELK